MKNIKSYQDAIEYLGNKKERPFANNTRIERDTLNLGHDVITVKYHGNPVVNFYPEYTSFDSCGWKTITTKERINWFLPDGFSLYQEKSVWYIRKHGTSYTFGFMDGITIDRAGNVYNDAWQGDIDKVKIQIKAIKQFVDGYISALINGEVESPSGGDCWHCYMVTDDGRSLGDATGNTSHIESHLEESYFVPSMLYNATKFKDMSGFAKSAVAQIWQGESITSNFQKDILVRDVKSSLTAYLKHELGIAQ